jgi:hypothetical protein
VVVLIGHDYCPYRQVWSAPAYVPNTSLCWIDFGSSGNAFDNEARWTTFQPLCTVSGGFNGVKSPPALRYVKSTDLPANLHDQQLLSYKTSICKSTAKLLILQLCSILNHITQRQPPHLPQKSNESPTPAQEWTQRLVNNELQWASPPISTTNLPSNRRFPPIETSIRPRLCPGWAATNE